MTPWIMWLISSAFFAYQFVVRLCPGLIMPQIMERYGITASSYGLLSSMYYLGYAGAQIPVAILLDRYGPRKVISACALICSVATLLFLYTDHWQLLLVSRLLVGAASAAGFLGVSKVASQWFNRERFGTMLGLSLTIGFMGAIYGGRPVSLLMTTFGWERVLQIVALFAFVVFILLWTFLKDSGPYGVREKPFQMSDLKDLCKHKHLFILGLSNLLMVGALEGFADVWGISFVMKSHEISRDDAALIVSMIFTGMLIGGPLLATLAQRWKAHLEIATFAGLFMGAAFVFILGIGVHTGTLYWLLLLVGVFCSYQILILELGARTVPASLLGLTVALLNCINMLGGTFFHGAIGWLLDAVSLGELENGVRIYAAHEYGQALWIIPAGSIVGALCLILIRARTKSFVIQES